MSGSGRTLIPQDIPYNPMAAQNAQAPGYQVALNYLQGQAGGTDRFPRVGPMPAVAPVSLGIPAPAAPTTPTETGPTRPVFDPTTFFADFLGKMSKYDAAELGKILSSQLGRPVPSWWGNLGNQPSLTFPTATTPNAIAPNVPPASMINQLAGLLPSAGTAPPSLPVPTLTPTPTTPTASLWNLIRSYNNG